MTSADSVEDYRSLVEVIRAILEQDKVMLRELKRWAIQLGKNGEGEELPPSFMERVDLGEGISVEDLKLETGVLNVIGMWDVWFGMLLRYIEENRNALVRDRFVMDGMKLGKWVGTQRTLKKGRSSFS